jgi:hypothetical protein
MRCRRVAGEGRVFRPPIEVAGVENAARCVNGKCGATKVPAQDDLEGVIVEIAEDHV